MSGLQQDKYLNDLNPDAVQVELCTEAVDVSADRPAADCTPRVIPIHPEAFVPIKSAAILWNQ